MAEKSSPKSIEYVENDFSSLNTHVDGILYNEKQISRLKKYRVDRIRIIQFAAIILLLGLLAIMLAIAYHWLKAPVYKTIEVEIPKVVEVPVIETIEVEIPKVVEVPVIEYITKIEYVPDPAKSIVEEVPVYIEKIIRGPIQIVGVNDTFSFFRTEEANGIDGVRLVKVGASYESTSSPFPEKQWCYAVGFSKSENTSNDIDLGTKTGKNKPVYKIFNQSDAKEFGASVDDLKRATKRCNWFADRPPTNEGQESLPPPSIESGKPSLPPKAGSYGTGTGFFINSDGYLVTNQHVVDTKDNNSIDSCSSIWIDDGRSNKQQASIVEQNINLDLAVLRINNKSPNYAKFGNVRSGANIIQLGFPLTGLLGDEMRVTNGSISALSGIKGDKNLLQHSAPSHPGNSGGPILNSYGLVVGVVKSGMVGEEYQNINFAIKGTTAQSFFGKNAINFELGQNTKRIEFEDIAEDAKKFTVKVICYN